MRVLQVVTDRDRRGAQVYATDLQPGLEAVGCEVTTVALAPGEFNDALEVETLGPTRLAPATLRELRRRAADHDVVIAHGSTCLPACSIALPGSGRPFVYRQISDPIFWAGSWPKRLRSGALMRRAGHIVALDDSVAEVVAHHYRLSRSGITVIPNAVPGHNFVAPSAQARAAARASFGVADDEFLVAYAGALAVEKGVADAIDAVAPLSGMTLLIAGEGPERKVLESLAEQHGSGNVRFLGSLDDVQPLYAAADIFVMPSRGGDSMPAVIIEANLCGVPVVACPIGAIEAVVRDGETGIIVPSNDVAALRSAVERLAASPTERADMGQRAEQRGREKFTIEATASAWVDVLRGL